MRSGADVGLILLCLLSGCLVMGAGMHLGALVPIVGGGINA